MQKPKTIHECMLALDEALSAEDKASLLESSKEDLITWHHNLGCWIRNNWGLWEGTELFKYMISLGFIHPDDMSQSLIVEYWNRHHHLPSDLDKSIKEYAKFWQKDKK
jgi:hypothetical protein